MVTEKSLIGLRVAVYRNLHKNCFSVQYKGKIIAHVPKIHLKNVEFRVSEAGRQRVLREKCKNVHAKVHGTVIEHAEVKREVYYNPYETKTFVMGKTPVFKADFCTLRQNKVFI